MDSTKLLEMLDQKEQHLMKMADETCQAWKDGIQEAVLSLHKQIWDMRIKGSLRVSLDELSSTSQPKDVFSCSIANSVNETPMSPTSPMSSAGGSEISMDSPAESRAPRSSFPRQTTPAPAQEEEKVEDDFGSEVTDADGVEVEATRTMKVANHKRIDKFLLRTSNSEEYGSRWKMRVQTIMDYVAGLLVLLNSVVMMLELEFEGRAAGTYLGFSSDFDVHLTEDLFQAFDRIFVFLFMGEWLVRVTVEKTDFFRDVANCFDTCLVLSGIIDLFVSILASDDQGASRSIVVLRLMRALKSLRAIRMVRSLRFFQGLRVLVKACQCFLPSLCWAMVLLGIFMAMGALLLGNLLQDFIKDETIPQDDRLWIWLRYGTTFQAMYTLFEITFAGNWPTSARPVVEKVSAYFVVFFVPYICIVVFAIIRVISAVFLKDTLDAAQNDAEQLVIDRLRLKEQYVNKLEGIFRAIDESGDGIISEERLSSILSNEKVVAYFQTLDLDVKESHALFHLLDNGDGEVTLDEFIDGIMRCKGPARAIDQVAMHSELKQLDVKVTKLFRKLLKVSKASHHEIKSRNRHKQLTAMSVFRGDVSANVTSPLGPSRNHSKNKVSGTSGMSSMSHSYDGYD